jgi:VanZ family protein
MFPPRLPALSVIAAAILVSGLLLSAPYAGGIFTPPWDKLAHFGFFGCITFLLAVGLGRRRIHLAFVAAVAVGIVDESYQAFLPTRHADWADLLTDVIAATCAALLARHVLPAMSPERPVAGSHDPDSEQQVGQAVGNDRGP